jgi:hypothetical protein
MLIRIATFVAACALAGCAETGPTPQTAAAQSDLKACDGLSTHVRRARCRNAVYIKHGNHGAVWNIIAAERVALAEKVDAGTLTQAEAEAEFARVQAKARQDYQPVPGYAPAYVAPVYVEQNYVSPPPPQLNIPSAVIEPMPSPMLPNYGQDVLPQTMQPGYGGNAFEQNMCLQHGTLC